MPWLGSSLSLARKKMTTLEGHLIPHRFSFPVMHLQFETTENTTHLHLRPPIERVAFGKAAVHKAEAMQDSIMIGWRLGDVNDTGSKVVKWILSVIPEVSV